MAAFDGATVQLQRQKQAAAEAEATKQRQLAAHNRRRHSKKGRHGERFGM